MTCSIPRACAVQGSSTRDGSSTSSTSTCAGVTSAGCCGRSSRSSSGAASTWETQRPRDDGAGGSGGMTIRAVLFDVGGPIDTEVRHEQVCDEYILKALWTVGVNANEASLAEASDWAVSCFAPQAYAAIISRL